MTNSTTAHTSPRRSHNQLTIDEYPFILKESTDKKSVIHCSNNERCNSPKTLHTISTGTAATTDTNAIADLLDDDEENHPQGKEGKDFLTFLKEWVAFYLEFVNLLTYALVHSSADSNLTFNIVNDDDDDDDRSMSYGSD